MTDPIDFTAAERDAGLMVGWIDNHATVTLSVREAGNLARAYLALVKDREHWTKEREEMRERLIRYSWAGQVDRMSGAFDPNDRHEMGG